VRLVLEVRTIMVCADCPTSWELDARPACDDTSHRRGPWEVHLHRSPVELPDGTTVIAVSFDVADPYRRDDMPSFGLYLDERWQPPWTHEHVDWPDFGVPADADAFVASLRSVLAHARSGERVELGCLGAHGRTGTALACLAVLTGVPAGEAVAWVRTTYCDEAIETPAQEDFVASFAS
jgi:hypothetical protein